MGLTVDDLRPKKFTVSIRGVELQCSPLRLSHALEVAKIGNLFQDPASTTKEQMKQAQADLDEVIAELIPELGDIKLDMADSMELIPQLMANVQPSDNQELAKKGVKFNADDPKAKVTG